MKKPKYVKMCIHLPFLYECVLAVLRRTVFSPYSLTRLDLEHRKRNF